MSAGGGIPSEDTAAETGSEVRASHRMPEPRAAEIRKASESPVSGSAPQPAGKVWLVGAGPGDPGLLTVKGLRALERADVIVADRLGARAVLDGLAAEGVELSAEVVDVGKRPGHHAVPQDAINALLVQLAQDGKSVVRLKGGDPYVFGRGGEELAACQDAGVEVEVVPGITSAISVPAVAGIPLTHRGVATAFTVVTGHDQIRALGGSRDHTVVLLMGVGTLAHSALVLAGGDRGADCPVAIVEDGFGPGQRVTIGTLATIAQQAALRGVRSPAVVVVGDVVRLSPFAPAEIATLDLSAFDPLSPPASPSGSAPPKGILVTSSSLLNLRVAIVGAGPAGIYAGNILANSVQDAGGSVAIDLFESLPAPYGLIRYGVAPDHPRIKGIVTSLHEMLDAGTIRFIGNVEVGRDIALEELHERYDAVILATGAIRDADLPIPGIELPGSFGAADFVAWFDGHPDVPADWTLDGSQVAVIGNGNVALDVARILAKHAEDLRSTEIADNVLAGLEASAVTDVHVFGRRGPADIKFTPIELRELGEVPNVDIVVHDEDFAYLEGVTPANNQMKVMLRVLESWRTRESSGASRRLHLHFYHAPLEVLGSDRVEGLRFERTEPTGDGGVRGTGEIREFPIQQVYRAVGYYGTPVVDAPFDDVRGVIPNHEGRVTNHVAAPVTGLYATGWIKRGPVGLIGHTKSDAMETVAHLVADATEGRLVAPAVDGDVLDLLVERDVAFTTWNGWLALDAHERELGAGHRYTRERVKVVPRDEQVAISRSDSLIGT